MSSSMGRLDYESGAGGDPNPPKIHTVQLGYSGGVAQRPIDKGGFLCLGIRSMNSCLHQIVATFEPLNDWPNRWLKVLYPNG
uniref:Uncharacterized protein n=1 Tax=Parascaris equorum TaxID=6256 RepID=A0A914S951_PAREQ